MGKDEFPKYTQHFDTPRESEVRKGIFFWRPSSSELAKDEIGKERRKEEKKRAGLPLNHFLG